MDYIIYGIPLLVFAVFLGKQWFLMQLTLKLKHTHTKTSEKECSKNQKKKSRASVPNALDKNATSNTGFLWGHS